MSIWDQGGDARPSPQERFDYGAEFRKDHLNAGDPPPGRYTCPRRRSSAQSQMGPGLARHARREHRRRQLAASARRATSPACSSLFREDDVERRKSFYDSTRIAHAVDYLIGPRRRARTARSRSTSAWAPTATPTTARAPLSAAGSTRRWPCPAAASASPPATPGQEIAGTRATSAT